MVIKNIFNPEWNYNNRKKYLEKLENEKFDLIIIGGGATGAGIAREAALRGIKTALVDKNDFAFGTSSKSSKLTHGGLRYLSYGEFKIVRESTTERNWLRVHFPNLVRPLAFNFCSYEGGKDKVLYVKAGPILYDFLSDFRSKFKNYKKHRFFTKEEFMKEEPAAKSDGFLMAGQYFDNNVDDSRLVLETIKDSMAIGDVTAVNYVKVEDYILKDGKIEGVEVKDNLNGNNFQIYGTQVVNATGIWTDELLRNFPRKIIRPTKGVHLVVKQERLGNNKAFGLRSVDDGRFFFVLRREEFALIGTTDTDYTDNFDEPYCNKEDCDYLFNTVNIMFPDAHLTYDDIISTYAGIRPLVIDENAKDESAVSRKHVIFDTEDGLTTISGGKHTIYRLMGEDLIFHLIKNKKLFEKKFSKKQLKKGYSQIPFLIGLKKTEWDEYIRKEKPNLPEDTLYHLYQEYGKGAYEIVDNIIKNPELSEPFLSENQFSPAEIDYIMKYEFAPTLMDILCRRTEIFMKIKHNKQREIAEKVAEIMKDEYNWDETRKNKEIEKYLEYISKTIWF